MSSPHSQRGRAGVTLIELGVLLTVLAGAAAGLLLGLQAGRGLLGLVVGGLAGLAIPLSVAVLVSLVAAAGRALSPPSRRCTCGRAPEAGARADPLIALLPFAAGETHAGRPSPEVSLAGLASIPPRLLLTWACACAARALEVHEAEVHQDHRLRIIWERARAALEAPTSGAADALASCALFLTPAEGCSVVSQSFWSHVLGRQTSGLRAASALHRLRHMAQMYAQPSALWVVHGEHTMPDAYDSPQMRLSMVQPAQLALGVAEAAALAAEDAVAERGWQRRCLEDFAGRWQTLEEDKSAWAQRVEREWVPRVRAELTRARFDVGAFANGLTAALVPWQARAP